MSELGSEASTVDALKSSAHDPLLSSTSFERMRFSFPAEPNDKPNSSDNLENAAFQRHLSKGGGGGGGCKEAVDDEVLCRTSNFAAVAELANSPSSPKYEEDGGSVGERWSVITNGDATSGISTCSEKLHKVKLNRTFLVKKK